jgi:HEPN domain-containing protein
LPERESSEQAAILARKAEEDAKALRKLAASSEIADDIVGFHAQQAVEKWLKAVIAGRGQEFEYTHDLRHLIALAEAACGDFPFDTAQVIVLTEYAVPLRYEEVLDAEPLDRDATTALVEDVGRWANTMLKAPNDS